MSKREHNPYRELFERSADAILIIEGETFVDCNQATVEMLRYERKEQVLRTHPSELSPAIQPDGRDSFEKANEMISIAFARGSHRFEWDHRRADGEVFPVEVLLTAVAEGGKRILHVVWRDITERKRLEAELRHAQKMEAIGKLAGGIAHDFNNLLVAIIGHADLLGSELAEQEELLESVEQIQAAGLRAAELVRKLLAVGRKQELRLEVLDLGEVVRGFEKLLKSLVGEEIQLDVTCGSQALPVRADFGQLEQILINLVTNARDAMSRGALSIELREISSTEATSIVARRLDPGSYALLAVADTGCGMDEATRARAFEPFFTTKGMGKGSGLGLATVYGIVEQSGGAVEIHSEKEKGTEVVVVLPMVPGSPRLATTSRHDLPSASGGSETILVVEDEPAVSGLIVRLLRSRGYRILQASDGHEALEIWRRHGGEIDLLLSDVVMPRMGGAELVARLRAAGETPRVLFTSGYTGEALTDLRDLGEEIDLLHKPFESETLLGKVRQALDRA